MEEETRQLFYSNPSVFIENTVREFVRSNPMNRLDSFSGSPVFTEPLVGFADGNDFLFKRYKSVIADFHLTPREVLSNHIMDIPGTYPANLPVVSVISYVLPIAKETRLSNRRETRGPSLRWNHTRWQGQEFIFDLSRHLVSILNDLGYEAIDPEQSSIFKVHKLSDGFASTWSQRHVAYVAGLGTFSLNDGFITPKGIAVRLGSVVTNLKLPYTPHKYSNPYANCLFYKNGSCKKCIERCPYGAITEKGHDKEKCREAMFEHQKPWMDGAYGVGYIGKYAGCGLCQTGVPCENRIPIEDN